MLETAQDDKETGMSILSFPRALHFATGVLLIASTGCTSAMNHTQPNPDAAPHATTESSPKATLWEWPLKFTAHNFSTGCFDTQTCSILYGNFPHGPERPAPSVESYGRPFEKLYAAKRLAIRNFPPPAIVTWRSRDGTPHRAEVDMAEIFKDGLIRHHLRREEIANTTNMFVPDIILEVNDRTINVYMRAHISTIKEQKPGNPHSNFRNDLIKVYSQTY
ncbi:hypothetical protein EBB59_11115 [Lysobacter pythonis]|uniref:Uncharacterized protein n=1 Tax=Solilutibacter pythonis TaxID=2483112 RepID=A0A3M2HM99_9GAMM|nr:hypothetical protein [Lysobacter pythonis]RMH89013.1 hypothetical protein EBB59_11115 [Lysobacter pythonis]